MKKFQVTSMIAILILWLISRVYLELKYFKFFVNTSVPISEVVSIYIAAIVLLFFTYIIPGLLSGKLTNIKILILLPLLLLSIPAYFDFVNKYVVQWNQSRRLQEYYKDVEKTKIFYKGILKQGLTYEGTIYYSNKSTIYSFSTTETPTLESVRYLLNVIKPVDNLDIIVHLLNEAEKNQWTMRFDNNKQLARCEESLFPRGNIFQELCK